jgi:hypothetical protein
MSAYQPKFRRLQGVKNGKPPEACIRNSINIEREMVDGTISLETSMGTAIAVQVAPMTWEVTYPWKEEQTIIGPTNSVTAQISRYIGRVDRVFM